jgi:hypothetical protein
MTNKLSFSQTIKAGSLAAFVATVINLVLYYALHAAGIFTDDIMIQPNQPLTAFPVAFSSVLPSLVGASVFFLFEKFSSNGLRNFTTIAILLCVLSFINPFAAIHNVTVAYGIGLNVMHVVVCGALLFFLKKAKNQIVLR